MSRTLAERQERLKAKAKAEAAKLSPEMQLAQCEENLRKAQNALQDTQKRLAEAEKVNKELTDVIEAQNKRIDTQADQLMAAQRSQAGATGSQG